MHVTLTNFNFWTVLWDLVEVATSAQEGECGGCVCGVCGGCVV